MGDTIPKLMLVVESLRSGLPLATLVTASVEGGCDAIQLRDRALPRSERRRRLAETLELVAGRALVLVNGDPDLAAEFGVGVHLPEHGLPPDTVRAATGPDAIIGRSVHSPSSAADSTGADYLLAGHVYDTPSHPGELPIGLVGLGRIVAATEVPVLAIGGINRERVADILATGTHGIAVIGAIAGAADRSAATEAARELRTALERGRQSN